MSQPTETPAAAPKAKTNRRWGCQMALIIAIAALVIVGVVGYWKLKSVPTYWQANRKFIESKAPAELAVMGEHVEMRVLNEMSSIRPVSLDGHEPPYKISLTIDEANAWLATKLPEWLANQQAQLPAHTSDPMIAVEDGTLIMAFKYDTPEISNVMSLKVHFELLESGQATLRVDQKVDVGQLGVPMGVLAQHLKKNSPTSANTQAVDKLVKAFEGQTFDPVVKVDETRQARVKAFKFSDNGLEMTMQNEAR